MKTNISQITENLDALHDRLWRLNEATVSIESEYNNYLDDIYPTAEVCGVTISKPSRILETYSYTTWRCGLSEWIDQQIKESNIEDNIKELEKILSDNCFEIDFFQIVPISRQEYEDWETEESQVHDFKYKTGTSYTGEYVSLYTGNYIYIEIADFLYVKIYCGSSHIHISDITEDLIFNLAQKIAEKLD